MKIVLHIGWHKTGTTSIQSLLVANRALLQRDRRTYYPAEGLLQGAHHLIAWTYQGKKSSPWGEVPEVHGGGDSYVQAALQRASQLGCDTVVFSSEEFCTFGEQEIRQIGESLLRDGHVVKVAAYIRRQDKIIESAYNMEVKWWGVRANLKFDDYWPRKTGYPDYYRVLSAWAKVFGQDALAVRCFERNEFDQGDVCRDFCTMAGIEPEGIQFVQGDVNESLGPASVEFLRILNQLTMKRETHEQVVNRLFRLDRASSAPTCVLFTPAERVAFMIHLQKSNSRLAELGIETRPLEMDVTQLPAKNVHPLTLDEFAVLADSIRLASLGSGG
jgi:hypothetical protein